MKKTQFKFHYFQECKKCGYRLPVTASQFNQELAIVDERTDFKCSCGALMNWKTICIIETEEILPRM